MEDVHKKVLLGALAVGVVGAGVFWATSASAKGLTGVAYVLQMFRTKSYKVLPSTPDMPMVEPQFDAPGPTLLSWAIAEQKKGRAVLVPAGYYAGTMAVSPSQIVSLDQRLANFFSQSGLFKVLPKVDESGASTGADPAPGEFPWEKVAIGAAVLGVLGGGAYYLNKSKSGVSDDYVRQLVAARPY